MKRDGFVDIPPAPPSTKRVIPKTSSPISAPTPRTARKSGAVARMRNLGAGTAYTSAPLSKIGRREVLQAFGMIATGALAGAFPKAAARFIAGHPQSAATAGKAFPVTTVNHLAMSAASYTKSRDFYVDLFGMRVAWDDGKQCALEFGSLTAPNGMYIRPLRPGEKPAIGHMAFGIPNFMPQKAAMKAEMERRGVRNIRPDGERGWSCDDPAGYLLNIWVPEKDKAMFPGAAAPCVVAASKTCVAAWEAGEKNLSAAPKPSGKGFQATSYSFIVLTVPDVSKERDFYSDLLGMRVIYDRPEGPNGESFLSFGQNTLWLRKTSNPAGKPYCNQFGFALANYDHGVTESELKRRGLNPKPDSKLSWSFIDPDGYRVGVSAAGFAEHIANDCHGSSASCPGGPGG